MFVGDRRALTIAVEGLWTGGKPEMPYGTVTMSRMSIEHVALVVRKWGIRAKNVRVSVKGVTASLTM